MTSDTATDIGTDTGTDTGNSFATEAHLRLTRAEQTGLRLALVCRSVITGAAFAWYGLAALLFPEITPRFATILVLLGFTALGVAHLVIIGTSYDRPWIKYAIYGLDALAICLAFAAVPISRSADIPQIIAFRAYGIYFLFPLLAMACLSLSWRLVLWTGAMIVIGWWAAFAWVVRGMERYTSWADMPTEATQADYEAVFLSIDFIGRGNRVEESAMIVFLALVLALAVYRARAVFFAQVAADVQWQHERSMRARVTDLLGRYVPETVAKQLIEDQTPLKPQRSHGTALVMDIANFTAFSAQHDPETVIATLDHVLSETSEVVAAQAGVVLSYLGDGFLAAFNAPVAHADPQNAAVQAAKDIARVAKRHGFDVRVGIASGALVTGIIGSDTRQAFTVYGDAVNLASRLETACKSLETVVAIDATTADALKDTCEILAMGAVSIRGMSEPVNVFTLPEDLSETVKGV